MIGPLLFTVGFIVQGLFRHDEYDPIAETVSALEAGPNGWIQQLNFFVFGILMMIFGAGLGFGLRTRRWRIASAIVAWWAVGLLWPACFRSARMPTVRRTIPRIAPAERRGLLLEYMGRSGRNVLVSTPRRPVARSYPLHPDHQRGVGAPVCCAGRFAIPSAAPLQPWAGLLQRAVLAVWFSCLIMLATRLWQVRRASLRTR